MGSYHLGNGTTGVILSCAEDALHHFGEVLRVLFLAWKGKLSVCVASKLYVLLGVRSAVTATHFLRSSKFFDTKHDLKSLCLFRICYKTSFCLL